ncbi:hypothetical protein [Desulfoplanes sp.]
MQKKPNFWMTWPSLIVFIPFLLIFVSKVLGVLIFSGPPSLVTTEAGLRFWTGSFLGGSILLGAVLYVIYRVLTGTQEDGK